MKRKKQENLSATQPTFCSLTPLSSPPPQHHTVIFHLNSPCSLSIATMFNACQLKELNEGSMLQTAKGVKDFNNHDGRPVIKDSGWLAPHL